LASPAPISDLTVSVELQPWLTASLSSTTTPTVVTISLSQPGLNGMTVGTYSGSVVVKSPHASNWIQIPVLLNIIPAAPRLSLSPSSLIFNAYENGAAPPSQTLVVGASNAGVAVSSNPTELLPDWLTLYSPTRDNPIAQWTGSGIAPITISVRIRQGGFAPGMYSYEIPFSSAQGSNVTFPITLAITAPALKVSANQLQLQCSAGLVNESPQTIQIQSTSGTPLNASVALSVPWLATNVQSGTTPFGLNIEPDCGALAVGTYTGKVTIADSSFSDSQTINVVLTVGQPLSSIASVTNAAVPGLDSPPSTVTLAPRSMATIFGSNLADSIAVSPSPGSSPLGGTEVHLAGDTCFDASCDLIANLLYVSPAQINFLVPDSTADGAVSYRIVLLRDGERIDDQPSMLGGPGRLIVDPSGAADSSVVFEVGYDCLFSSSVSDPASCGLSWSTGQDRAPVGAITDALSGQLISPRNPVYQGRLITLWMTALRGGVALDSQTGLQTGKTITPIGFGVAQSGKDIEGTLGVQAPTAPNMPSVPIGTFMSPTPLWAGESPQFTGLDQVNVAFPTCTGVPDATAEKRYDAFLTYTSLQTGATSRIYIPFGIRVGDPDCQWVNAKTSTTIALTSSPNPSTVGQATVLTATVSPSTATGVVTFFDGSTMLGNGTLSAGVAALSVSTLTIGTHSITAVYDGDANCTGSTATYTQTVKGLPPSATTVTIGTNPNPVMAGQKLLLQATVSPASATGAVTFFDGTATLGSATLDAGSATLYVSVLSVGNHSITATYGGDANYASGTSAMVTETVVLAPSTIAFFTGGTTVSWGTNVALEATVSPSTATGTVTFFEGLTDPAVLATVALNGGKATYSVPSPSTGTHFYSAVYSGDADTAGGSSWQIRVLVNPAQSWVNMVSNQNPSSDSNPTPGALFTATVTPADVGGYVTFSANPLIGGPILCTGTGNVPVIHGQAVCSATPGLFPGPGVYSIRASYGGDGNHYGSDSAAIITQTVTQ
jgi:hypothetical protein